MNDRIIMKTFAWSAMVGAWIGSSGAFAAPISVECSYTKDKKTSFCLTNNDGDERLWRCDKTGKKTWKCGEVKSEASQGTTGEPDFKNVHAAVRDAARRAKGPARQR